MSTKDKIKAGTKKTIEGAKRTRFFSKTPKFWKNVRLAGLSLAAIGGAIVGIPIGLPAAVTAWGSYIATIGGSLAGIAQFAKEDDK